MMQSLLSLPRERTRTVFHRWPLGIQVRQAELHEGDEGIFFGHPRMVVQVVLEQVPQLLRDGRGHVALHVTGSESSTGLPWFDLSWLIGRGDVSFGLFEVFLVPFSVAHAWTPVDAARTSVQRCLSRGRAVLQRVKALLQLLVPLSFNFGGKGGNDASRQDP